MYSCKLFDASRLTVDTITCGFLWYTFSEAGVLPEAVAVVMIVIFMRIKDSKELREGPVCTRQIFEQSSPPHFSLQVVCKKGGVFSGAYSMYFGTCNRISMKLAFFCLFCHDNRNVLCQYTQSFGCMHIATSQEEH